MASLGAIPCSLIDGRIPPLATVVQAFREAGYAGYGSHALGQGSGEFLLRVRNYTTTAALVRLWAESVHALQSTTVTVTRSDDEVFSNCLIVNVIERTSILAAIGNGYNFTQFLDVYGVRVGA